MKVILIENVPSLGNAGQIKDVKEGFALNFLIPSKKAVLTTDPRAAEILALKNEKKKEEKIKGEITKEKFDKITGKTYIFKTKADDKGHLYGSIGPKEMATEIGVDEALIKEHFKQVGIYPLEINFGKDLMAKIKIEIKKK